MWRNELFGLVIIEAISSGTPVVIGSNLMFELGSGYYMYHNEEEFVSMVDKALSGASDTDNVSCREVVEKYNWTTVARQYTELFEKQA